MEFSCLGGLSPFAEALEQKPSCTGPEKLVVASVKQDLTDGKDVGVQPVEIPVDGLFHSHGQHAGQR